MSHAITPQTERFVTQHGGDGVLDEIRKGGLAARATETKPDEPPACEVAGES